MTLTTSALDPKDAVLDATVLAGDPWIGRVQRGQTLRIVDLEGNQAVDTLFYSAADLSDRYSASDTIRMQGALYLTTGSVLRATSGAALLTITADTCGRHDTLGGACSAESNTVRYGHHTKHMHACRDSFLIAIEKHSRDAVGGVSLTDLAAVGLHRPLEKRDITCNINFFMNVPVTPDGKLTFEDGVSGSGKYVELRAEQDVICLISNCPQLNNPCNAYNPTPVRVLVWNG
jgi:urea carboxylase-associated protein 1